ncbi:MAG: DNA internalization-related competence protein ComEC/Rec2 [Ignavibacteriaceae bacterium]
MKPLPHPTPLISIFFATGIVISSLLNVSLYEAPALGIIAALFIPIIFFKRYTQTIKIFYISFLTIITGFIAHEINDLNPVKIFAPDTYLSSLEIHGKIETLELPGQDGFDFTVVTDSIGYNGKVKKAEYVFLVQVKREYISNIDSLYSSMAPGRRVSFKGNMYNKTKARVPGEFNYFSYLTTKGISGVCYSNNTPEIRTTDREKNRFGSYILGARLAIAKIIQDNTNPESAALLKSLLLGDRSDISQETKADFITSGVMHVLAISGLHVGFITIIFLFLFGRFGIVTKSVLTITGLIAFFLISGMSISVFRAVIMASVFLIARISDRETSIYNSLGIAALLLLVIDPDSLFNASFQLSFTAVFSIAYFYPYFEERIERLQLKFSGLKWLLKMFAVSFSAQTGTLPLIILYFGKLSIISLAANLIVIPMTGVIIGIGILLIPVSAVSSYFAALTGSAADGMIRLLFDIVAYSSSFSFASVNIAGYNILSLLIFYFFIFLLFRHLKDFSGRIPKIILTIFVIVNIYLFTGIVKTKFFDEGKLNILFIDVGQGDAALIKFPGEGAALIDGGDIKIRDRGDHVLLPLFAYLGIEKIDYGFITHYDSDHFGGFLKPLYRNKICKLIIPPADTSKETERKLLRFINAHSSDTEYFSKQIISKGEIRIFLMNNPIDFAGYSNNERSCVIMLQYGKNKILFTGDIEKEGEEYLKSGYGDFLNSDVLKVAHHGSKTSTSEEFLEAVTPEISVISVGGSNPFGHPHVLTLSALERAKSEIHRTDRDGSVLVVVDGRGVRVKEWRE